MLREQLICSRQNCLVARGNASPSQSKRKAAREDGRADRGKVPLNALTMAFTAPTSTPSGGHSGVVFGYTLSRALTRSRLSPCVLPSAHLICGVEPEK